METATLIRETTSAALAAADKGALDAITAFMLTVPMMACPRCKGKGYLPRQRLMMGRCLRCWGRCTVPARGQGAAVARAEAAAEVERLRATWRAYRAESKAWAALAETLSGWRASEARHSAEKAARHAESIAEAGKRAAADLVQAGG